MTDSVVSLPPVDLRGCVSLEETISRRRSVRRYRADALGLSEIGQMAWSAQGIIDPRGSRAVPSAGAAYPLVVYLCVGERGVVLGEAKQPAEPLGAGIYRYEAGSHSLRLHRTGDLRAELARAALNQEFITEAPVRIVICALYERTAARYGARAERYVHMEVGHAGQNVHLQAVALGLATVMVGAFRDEEVALVLGVAAEIKPLYLLPIGRPQ